MADSRVQLRNSVDGVRITDEELMGLVAQGDQKAFDEIFERYHRQMYNFINNQVSDRQSVEDLVQEVFMRVYKSSARFDTSKKFSSWIYKIALNETKRHWKRFIQRQTYSLNTPVGRDSGDTERQDFIEDERIEPDDLTEQELFSRQLKTLIDRLPEKQKIVVVLKVYHDKTFEEIAEICECPLSTVLSRMRYAVNKLRRWLNVEEPGD